MGISYAYKYATTTLRLLFSPSFKVDNFLFENHPRRPTYVPLVATMTIRSRNPMLNTLCTHVSQCTCIYYGIYYHIKLHFFVEWLYQNHDTPHIYITLICNVFFSFAQGIFYNINYHIKLCHYGCIKTMIHFIFIFH
jgi:hypothetical protein